MNFEKSLSIEAFAQDLGETYLGQKEVMEQSFCLFEYNTLPGTISLCWRSLQGVQYLSAPPPPNPNTRSLVEVVRVGVWSPYFVWMEYLVVLEVGKI